LYFQNIRKIFASQAVNQGTDFVYQLVQTRPSPQPSTTLHYFGEDVIEVKIVQRSDLPSVNIKE